MPAYRFLIKASELPEKGMMRLVIDDMDLVVCNTKEGVFVVQNLCSHAMATLHDGRLRGCRLICPLHGASFDVRDGSVKGAPAFAPIRSFPARIVDGNVEADLSCE